MADKITFSKTLNTSVQIGDELWYSNISSGTSTAPTSLGTILEKGNNWVKIDSAVGTASQTNPNLITNGAFNLTPGPNPVLNPGMDTFNATSYLLTNWSTTVASSPPAHINWIYHASTDPFATGMDSTNTYTLDGSNRMFLDDTYFQSSGPSQRVYQEISSILVGDSYTFSFDYEVLAGTLIFDIWSNGNNSTWNNTVSLTGSGTYTQQLSALDDHAELVFSGTYGDNVTGYIDNVSVIHVGSAVDWYTDGTWDIIGQDKAIKIPGTAGYLYQDYATPLVEGEEYTLTMDIVSGGGDIKIVNTTIPNDVLVVVDAGVGTATWTQGSVNTNKLNIYQDGTGDAEIDNITLHMTSFDLATALDGTTPDNLFFMFRKPVEQNVSSLKGYYAESTFTNNSTAKQELFAVGSEVTISSK